MKQKNIVFNTHYDIINNILTNDTQKQKCFDMVNSYNSNQSNIPTETELMRFSRHIALENYFNNNNPENTPTNIEDIMEELSSVSTHEYSSDSDAVLSLQLSSTLDKLLKELSASDKDVYLCRYFFAYTAENIAQICGISIENVRTIITQCNSKLKELMEHENISTDCKSLLLSFTDIDETHLLSLIQIGDKKLSSSTNVKYKKLLTLCLSIFGGLAIIFFVLLSIAQYKSHKRLIDANKFKENNTGSFSDFNVDDLYIYIENNKIVNGEIISQHLISGDLDKYAFEYTTEDFYANYHAYWFAEDVNEEDILGNAILEISNAEITYYTLLGTDSRKYIISPINGKYAFFILDYPRLKIGAEGENPETSIQYKQVLSNFYGINSPNKIKEIYVAPVNPTNYVDTNTKKLISDILDLDKIHRLLANSTFTGCSRNEYIDLNGISHDYLDDNSVQLFIQCKDGVTIDSLYYYPNGNVFIDDSNSAVYQAGTDYGDTYLKELFDLYLPTSEIVDPELWDFHLYYDSSYVTRLYLNVHCANSSHTRNKYIGSDFTLERLVDGEWVTIEPRYDDIPIEPFSTKINGDSTEILLNITDKYYGFSHNTRYRVTVTIYDSTDFDNPASKDISTEFTYYSN